MTSLWSFNFIAGKYALREFPPVLLAALRIGIAALAILPVAFAGSGLAAWRGRRLLPLVGLGMLGVCLNQFFFIAGLSRTSVAHSSFVIALTPILVLLIAAAIGQEKITFGKFAGLVLAMVGVLFLQSTGGKAGSATLLGDALVFLAALSFALFTVFGKSIRATNDSVTVNAVAYVGSALVLAPLGVTAGREFHFDRVSAIAWAALVYMALFGSLFAYLMYYWALAHMPASRIAAFTYLEPLMASAIALPLLGESITPPVIVGGTLVLAGIFAAERF